MPWQGVDPTIIDREVAIAYGIDPAQLRMHGHCAGMAKAVAAELAARWTGMTNREIGAYYMLRRRLKSRRIDLTKLERALIQ